jgi:hypothetical protein
MQHNRFRRSFTAFAIAVTGATVAVAAGAASASAGVSGPAFFVDHVLYRTVATPTDLSGTGAPEQSFDTIYSFGSLQRSVATAAPGYRDFNGGRWAVHALDAPNGYAAVLTSGDLDGNGVIDATDEVRAALTSGDLVDTGVARWFVCTVNKVPNGQA